MFFFFFLGGGGSTGLVRLYVADPVQTIGPPSVEGVSKCMIFVSGISRI